MPETVGNISLYMGPARLGGPDDLESPIIDFIDGAKKRLHIAVQELDSRSIAEAITDARAKSPKVFVRLVLEADYLRAGSARKKPWVRGGKYEENREIQDALLRSAAWVRSDFNSAIFHQKFIVRDSEALLTGSTNFTGTGTTRNLNHLIVIDDPKVAKIYNREFTEIRHGRFGKRNEGHDEKPPKVFVSNVPVRVLFAPDHNPEMDIMKQMLKAEKSITFAMFTFSQSSGIDDTMKTVAATGIKVRGVLDRQNANQSWAATHALLGHENIKLFRSKFRPGLGKVHHKLMVIDERVVIAGSFNYTGPATRLNDENVIMLGSHDAASAESVAAQKKLAKYASDEINRIIDDLGEELTAS